MIVHSFPSWWNPIAASALGRLRQVAAFCPQFLQMVLLNVKTPCPESSFQALDCLTGCFIGPDCYKKHIRLRLFYVSGRNIRIKPDINACLADSFPITSIILRMSSLKYAAPRGMKVSAQNIRLLCKSLTHGLYWLQ